MRAFSSSTRDAKPHHQRLAPLGPNRLSPSLPFIIVGEGRGRVVSAELQRVALRGIGLPQIVTALLILLVGYGLSFALGSWHQNLAVRAGEIAAELEFKQASKLGRQELK